jgi:hypothetical protein
MTMWDKTVGQRGAVVEDLNSGEIDGIVMSSNVGACGHNIPGACRMLFIGPLYSASMEAQAIGELPSKPLPDPSPP